MEKKVEARRIEQLVNLIDLKKVALQEVKDEMIEALKAITLVLLMSDPSSFMHDLEKLIQKAQQELQ